MDEPTQAPLPQKRTWIAWIKQQDRNESVYWLGLLLLFFGLSWEISIARALMLVGAIMAGEGLLTSYLANWMARE